MTKREHSRQNRENASAKRKLHRSLKRKRAAEAEKQMLNKRLQS